MTNSEGWWGTLTTGEVVELLLEKLGLSRGLVEDARAAECRRILTDAFAAQELLPTSWFEVFDLVSDLERSTRQEAPGRTYDFDQIFGPLNEAVNTRNVPFPRGVV